MSGLLKDSFVPPQPIRELRTLHRHRRKLTGQRTAEKNRLQNILEDANIKLSNVVSDVFGKTGKAIIEALIAGVTDPAQLAELARGSLVKKKDQLKKALNGKITDHHRFMLQLIVNTITHINKNLWSEVFGLRIRPGEYSFPLKIRPTLPYLLQSGLYQNNQVSLLVKKSLVTLFPCPFPMSLVRFIGCKKKNFYLIPQLFNMIQNKTAALL